MTAQYNVSGYPPTVLGDAVSDILARLIAGVDTALTLCASATDPSTGAPSTWGVNQVGRPWLDVGVDGTAANPVLKVWCQLTAGPTYGWRRARLRKTKMLATPVAVSAINSQSPASANITLGAAPIDLTTTLDGAGVQDTGDTARTVIAAWLRVRFYGGAAETLGTGATEGPYLAFRKTGATDEQRVHAVADGAGFSQRMVERTIRVELDSGEGFDFGYTGGGGTKGATFEVYLLGFEEEV